MIPVITLFLLICIGSLAELTVHDGLFIPDYVLEARAETITIDCERRHSVTINGTAPGPTLMLREEQITWIRVYNRLPDQNLTMHWHGLGQRTAPFSDGTPLVSQWPIPPNQFFDYELKPERGDAGTYFYHSHVGFQMSTAHGALLVRDARHPAYTYDDNIIMMLGDHYRTTDREIESGLLGDPFKWSGEPQSITMQGHSGRLAIGEAADTSCAPHIIDVEPNKRYRIRVIGATVLSMVKIGIEDHINLDVIEADGSYTKPFRVDHMQVASGQRFSYLLKTKTASELRKSKKQQFWIRYESRDRPLSIPGYALLRYRLPGHQYGERLPLSLPPVSPVRLPNATSSYLEYSLEALRPTSRFPRLSEVTRTVTIQVNQMPTSGEYVDGKLNGSLVWVQNGNSWQENVQAMKGQKPYLIEVYLGGAMPNYTRALQNKGFDPVTKTFPVRVGEVLDIVWQNNGGITGSFDSHPMHIHGEHAWDLGSGNGTYNATENEKRWLSRTPARRDTTVLYRYTPKGVPHTTAGWRAWRIRVTDDNVGAWMMHCHVAQHTVMGMATVWVFGDADSILKKFPSTPYVSGYLDYGSSAYGSDAHDPFVNHFFT